MTALVVAGMITLFEERRIVADASSQLSILASSMEGSMVSNYNEGRRSRIAKLAERLTNENKISSLTLCNPVTNEAITFPGNSDLGHLCQSQTLKNSLFSHKDYSWTDASSDRNLQFFLHPVNDPSETAPSLVMILSQDLSSINNAWYHSFFRYFFITWGSGFIILFFVLTQLRIWLKENFQVLQQALRAMIAGKKPAPLPSGIADPISKELNTLAAKVLSLNPRNKGKTQSWLKPLQDSLEDKNLIVIANREPYIHQRKENHIEVVRPASGLVTALEPVLRQCGGLWIAHGSGSADFDVTNPNGEVQVPPSNPKYTLRRVLLTKEEELGYYYGFSNEGLWPLCHLAHNRPTFRLSDWEQYKSVNQLFTDAIPLVNTQKNSIILVQDYHFALVPNLIRERDPQSKSKIGIFWHIPWPNPEAFGICPWSQELLKGMLGSDIIGFHTQYHCNNLEARIDWERFSVTMDHHETLVRAFPIGIDTSPVKTLSDPEIKDLKEKYGIHAEIVAVGVDRLDYTKGLVERVEGVERLLEKHPEYIGKFTLVQMGSPSRTHIPAYRALAEQLEQTVQRVNARFSKPDAYPGYQPIVFLPHHHEWEQIQYFYQMGDLCLVTSLHDGMNLVAKEYVWCQRADRGALILSKFTGACRELTEAFIINPYSTEELADAIHSAIQLPTEEKRRRMLSMKEKIEACSAFHWASGLIRALVTKPESSSIPIPEQDRSNRISLVREF
jgi:trehalose 6-phosphate synthase